MSDVLDALRREFEAEDGTFMLRVRCDLVWDWEAFTRLERAMRAACELYQGQEHLDRWMAEGFYVVSRWVKAWTSHPNFPRPEPLSYYDACVERLDDLADWFFHGWPNYQEPHAWTDL